MTTLDLTGMVPARVDVRGKLAQLVRVGGGHFTEPFYDESIRRLLETGAPTLDVTFDELHATVKDHELALGGLIFHSGRCGSTLLTRMLGHDRAILTFCEPSVLGMLQRASIEDRTAATANCQVQIDLVRLLDGFATERGQRTMLKLHSWAALDCTTWLDRLDGVPAVFIHRSPVEVVASELHGAPGWAEWLPASLALGATAAHTPQAASLAAVWARIAEAVLLAPPDRMLMLSYDELVGQPAEVLERVAAQFGLTGSLPTQSARSELGFYAKGAPSERFDPGGAHARRPLTAEEVRQVAEVVGDLPATLARRSAIGARFTL